VSDPLTKNWYQSFFIPMTVPDLESGLQRWAMFTVFSLNEKQPYSGRLRIYILYSAEQVGKMVEETKNDHCLMDGFLEKARESALSGTFPEHDYEGLPAAEMSENLVALKMLAGFVFQYMTGQIQVTPNAEGGAESEMITSGSGEKAKA